MAFSKPRRSARNVQTGRRTGAFRQSESFSAPDKNLPASVRGAASSANPKSKEQPDGAAEFLFQHAVALAVSNAQLEDKLDAEHPHELLVPLDYADECRVKTDAVRSFWQVHGLPAQLVPAIVPSPVPRGYRATSKRRVYVSRGGQLRFCMGYGADREEALRSALEPDSHNEVYAWLRKMLVSPVYRAVGRSLNFIVVRGGSERLTLILNFFHLDAAIMHKTKLLADHVRAGVPQVAAMFTFLDETRSEFYLESRSAGAHPFKKLFGSEYLDLTAAGCKFLYPPSAFSQVNESILDAFLREAKKLLKPGPESTLIDLFSGYGLFAVVLGDSPERVVGMDFNGPAIHAASGNALHNRPDADIEFIAAAVTPSAIENKLPPCPADLYGEDEEQPEGELFILDPPRSGVRPNVIAAIAKRSPARVLNIFCSADEVPHTLKAWKHNGYSPSAVRVFDMFPGSPNVETMVLLEKTKRKPASATSHGKKNASSRKPRNAEKNTSSAPKSNRAARKAARIHGDKRRDVRKKTR
jgi:tRNA/tmRNA/rRNA uracil-C5-methylase (TrmA/RlmC/RlmD family)